MAGRVSRWIGDLKIGLSIVAAALGVLWYLLSRRTMESAGEARGAAAERIRRVREAAEKGDTDGIDSEWRRR